MRRRKRSVFSKERIVMAVSSVVILGTLTATGIWLGSDSDNPEDNVVDLSTIESEIVVDGEENNGMMEGAKAGFSDDLDYDPYFQETNSTKVENPDESGSVSMSEGVTGAKAELPQDNSAANSQKETGAELTEAESAEAKAAAMEDVITEGAGEATSAATSAEETAEEAAAEETAAETASSGAVMDDVFVEDTTSGEQAISTAMQPTLSFGEEDTLVWPIVGNVLINYSMDETIYFKTLDQYKYNPAIVIAANEGDMVTAAAAGKVTSVFYDAQIGNAVKMDLGNGYEITYGQLQNILVTEGSYVAMGDLIAEVAAPTKYYSLEGTNVYFMLTKDGEALNPMTRLHE